MASIKRYFRTTLIGLATFVLSNLQTNHQALQIKTDNIDDDSDVHMFI